MSDATEELPMKLEVLVIPVGDVDRSLRFYQSLGWRLDADYEAGPTFRIVQLTPPGSPCSIHIGRGVTPSAPGSAQGNYLVVSDIDRARADLISKGVEVTEPFHNLYDTGAQERVYSAMLQTVAATRHTPRSTTQTATAGSCKRSPSDNQDGDYFHPRPGAGRHLETGSDEDELRPICEYFWTGRGPFPRLLVVSTLGTHDRAGTGPARSRCGSPRQRGPPPGHGRLVHAGRGRGHPASGRSRRHQHVLA